MATKFDVLAPGDEVPFVDDADLSAAPAVESPHYLPPEEWEEVVANADAELERRLTEHEGGAGDDPFGITFEAVNYSNTFGKTSSLLKTGVQMWVIHTAECPLQVGYARSLTNWAYRSGYPEVSWHRFVDPDTVAFWIAAHKAGAWHATWANPVSIGYEQSGYARFTREEWLVPIGQRQIDVLAQVIVADKIPADAVRFLTDAEVAKIKAGDRTIKGLATHAQINPENRTDPGKGYPKDVLLDRIRHHHPDIDYSNEEFDMDEATLRNIIRDEIKAVFTEYQQGEINTTSERWQFSKAFPWVLGQVATIRNRQGEHRQENRDQTASILEAVKGISLTGSGGMTAEATQSMIDDSLSDLRVVPASNDDPAPGEE